MQTGTYKVKPGESAIAMIRVAPRLDAFAVKLNLIDNTDLVLMQKGLDGWDEIIIPDMLDEAVYRWDMSADGTRLAYRHLPTACPNGEDFCNGFKVVQRTKGSTDLTTVSESLEPVETIYDGVILSHDGKRAVSAWLSTITSPATGFAQTAVKIHDTDTGMQLGSNLQVDEMVLDQQVEEGDRVTYYAHNPFTNINRLDVMELNEVTGVWTDLVEPHPSFESWRFTPAVLMNNGEIVAYCAIDLEFKGVIEMQELRNGVWTILSDEQHGDLLGHPCRDIKVSTDHTLMLLNYQDANTGLHKMTMFGLADGSWNALKSIDVPEEVAVPPLVRGRTMENWNLAMDDTGSNIAVVVNASHPEYPESEQHFAKYFFACNNGLT